MTSDRAYRPAQSFQAARKEIEAWSGRQFDPAIVKVFLEMPDKIWEDLRKDINGPDRQAPYKDVNSAGNRLHGKRASSAPEGSRLRVISILQSYISSALNILAKCALNRQRH